MTSDIPEAAFWIAAAAASIALVLLVRQQRVVVAARRRQAVLEADLRARDEEVGHLAGVRLPTMLESSDRQGESVPRLLRTELVGTPFAQNVQKMTDLFIQSSESAQKRADQSAKAALKASMRALQGLSNEQQLAISEMQDAHDDPQVLHDLLEIDHMNAQFGRRAQAIAILCGSWPGRQRAAAPLVDVIRGATSRIRDYQRVQVQAQVDSAVISRAVEPVVLAVAELLDNAARHSQPNTTVQVSLQPAHNGVSMVIDDAGVGLHGREIQRAAALLSGRHQVDVGRLGDPPQFGFAVIGLLAARYGFGVSVDTQSPYGGVRAVVFLPSALLAPVDADEAAGRTSPPAVASQSPQVTHHTWSEDLADTAHQLPRRRRRAVASHSPTVTQPEPSPVAARSASDAATMLGAFSRGTRAGRGSTPDAEGMADE
jgi:two-component sensor histidine kinase